MVRCVAAPLCKFFLGHDILVLLLSIIWLLDLFWQTYKLHLIYVGILYSVLIGQRLRLRDFVKIYLFTTITALFVLK